jgi:hypothetical protein
VARGRADAGDARLAAQEVLQEVVVAHERVRAAGRDTAIQASLAPQVRQAAGMLPGLLGAERIQFSTIPLGNQAPWKMA